MKLLYKASIIILFACHLMTAIANNRQFNPSTEITGIYSHNNDQFHNYEGINSIVAQQNIDFAKYAFNESMDLMKNTVQKVLNLRIALLIAVQ